MLLPKIVGRLKMVSAKVINIQRQTPGHRLWQRNYWERIIRDEELQAVRRYIVGNPASWQADALYKL